MRVITFIILLNLSSLVHAELIWLGNASMHRAPYLDPASPQQSLSTLAYYADDQPETVFYAPVILSMRQLFLQRDAHTRFRWETGMEFTIYPQWTVQDVGEAYLGGLQNADYRIAGFFHAKFTHDLYYRWSLFHQSSHLGDDHILRQNVTGPLDRSLNYEQLDASLFWGTEGQRLYALLGLNVSPHTVRGRSLLQLGGEYRSSSALWRDVYAVAGIDLKWYEQNNFHSNLRIGVGLEIGRDTDTPFVIMGTWFKGNLPYSILEFHRVDLIGLSLFIPLPQSLFS